LLLRTQANIAEVSGSCICCNFNGFIDSIKQVGNNSHNDIIIAEPVGSCTDLSATIIQPLKEILHDKLVISPLTVLVDPFRLDKILNYKTDSLHPSSIYIFKKQLEESDIILLTKTDLLENFKIRLLIEKLQTHYPKSLVLTISSKTGYGIENWLNTVFNSSFSGQRIINIDYDIYAEGEAVLGWLNASITLQGKQVDWNNFVFNFLSILSSKIDSSQIGVGHIKVILENGTNYLTGNITGEEETIILHGDSGISDVVKFTINARIGTTPKLLDQLVRETLSESTQGEIKNTINVWNCLSPGYPNPTFRYKYVVK